MDVLPRAAVPGRTSLTWIQATSLMVGAGVGAGIMAVPYLAARTGVAELLLLVAVAYVVTCVIHLMLAEVIFRTGRDLQVVELMRLHLFRRSAVLVWLAFALLTTAFVAILAAYIAGGSEIVTELTGWPPLVSDLVVYACSASVVMFGLRGVGASERIGALILVLVLLVLAIGASGRATGLPWAPAGDVPAGLAVYAMVMYALFTFYTVPQVVQGLAPDHRAAVRAVVVGLAVNALLLVGLTVVALAVSDPVTPVASIGIARVVGGWAGTLGSLFVLVALITSYWSVSLALADVLDERIGIGARPSWLLATVPSLVLTLVGWRFLELLKLAGGATALVVVLVTVPMYAHARRTGQPADWTLGRAGSPAVLAVVVVAVVLMALGSFVEV